jgi:hypothetical protein
MMQNGAHHAHLPKKIVHKICGMANEEVLKKFADWSYFVP